MGSREKSDLEKEKEILETLQNAEKKFMKGTYNDFFGKSDTGKAGTGDGKPGAGSGQADGSAGSGTGTSPLTFGTDPETEKSSAKDPMKGISDKIDALEARGREITSALSSRRDALQRANDALKEVRSLLDNPLYNGMPSVTGKTGAGNNGTGTGGNVPGGTGVPGGADEIDPGLMAGSDGDLFTGFAGGNGRNTGGFSGTGGSGNTGGFPGTGGGSGSAGGQGTDGVTDPFASVQPAKPAVQGAAAQAAAKGAEAEKPKEPEKDPMEELDSLIGLTKIKHDVKELTDFVKIQKMRKDGGLKSVPVSLHLVFTGNPGTGKTTVARILGRLYKQIGVLSKGQLIEVDRSGLVAGYVGQTALKTAKKIEESKGGVLFIDEAYALARKDDTFGQEAIDTILKAMEDNREDFVVIVAGYTGPMETFINSNPGLKSRFNKYIEFPDYTIDELMGIFDMNCKKYDYEAEDDVKSQIRAMIVQRKLATRENFANAREVRNFFEEIITNQARRVAAMEAPTKDDMKKILMEDLTETAEEDAAKTLKKAEEAGVIEKGEAGMFIEDSADTPENDAPENDTP